MTNRHFDGYLPQVRADELKRMVRLWGGRSQMRKAECIETIQEGLRDPVRVRAALVQLDPLEQCALALVKQAGGAIAYPVLAAALYASGWKVPRSRYRGQSDVAIVQELVSRGVLLTTYRSDPGQIYRSYGAEIRVFSDPRLLAQIGFPQYRPFEIKPTTSPQASARRQPPVVVLDIIGALQAIERIGGLGVTQQGTVRVSDMRKLERALGRSGGPSEANALTLPDPARALVSALKHSGLLSFEGATWRPNKSLDEFAAQPYAEQVRPMLYGFAGAKDWSEWPALSDYRMSHLAQARWALIAALAALPVDRDGYYAIDDLGWALFERIGEHFSFGYVPNPPYRHQQTPDQLRHEQEVWKSKLRQGWQDGEQRWLAWALSTWLYYLGLIELGLDERVAVSVRLTRLGRALLHPELETAYPAQPDVEGAAWVIQPNFDVIVYLARTRPDQLAFLERHAERAQAQQHTAQYRLTRDSIYRGLESGTSLDELLSRLREGTDRGLPQNVEVEIREWAALRDRVVLYRQARLLEFADAEARQAALQMGLAAEPVGDRYLLLAPDAWVPPSDSAIDYARPLPRCLSVSEDGQVRVSTPRPDLLIAAQLDIWAERARQDVWQLTASSVAAAVGRGWRVGNLLNLLDARSHKSIPRLLRVALRAWSGQQPTVRLATVTVLKCPTPEVFEAVKTSARLKPYLCGVLAPDLLLVDTAQVDAFRSDLACAGVEVVDRLLDEKRQ
jgi:hypothetical protein